MEFKDLNDEFFIKEKEIFINCMTEKFSRFDLSNMKKNAPNISIYEFDSMQSPAKYISDCNDFVYSIKNIQSYGFSDDELRHMNFHELMHMSSTKRSGNILTTAKTGWGAGSTFFPKQFAITEGMTDYLAEVATGKKVDVGYLFEKRCAQSICEIFGDDAIQSFLNANPNELFKHAESKGIKRKEISQLFKKMDKSLMWRLSLDKDKIPKEKNNFIYQIEKDLIDLAVKVSINKGDTNEQTAEKITKIQSGFIPAGLKYENRQNEEAFISNYSQDLEKAFEYAEQQKEKLISFKRGVSQKTYNDKIKDFRENLEYKTNIIEELKKDSITNIMQNDLKDKGIEPGDD